MERPDHCVTHAIEYHEQSLAIAREIGDRYGESSTLVCLADIHTNTGKLTQACDHYREAVSIADETEDKQNQHEAYFGLALGSLLTGDLTAANGAIEAARIHDYPLNKAGMQGKRDATLLGVTFQTKL